MSWSRIQGGSSYCSPETFINLEKLSQAQATTLLARNALSALQDAWFQGKGFGFSAELLEAQNALRIAEAAEQAAQLALGMSTEIDRIMQSFQAACSLSIADSPQYNSHQLFSNNSTVNSNPIPTSLPPVAINQKTIARSDVPRTAHKKEDQVGTVWAQKNRDTSYAYTADSNPSEGVQLPILGKTKQSTTHTSDHRTKHHSAVLPPIEKSSHHKSHLPSSRTAKGITRSFYNRIQCNSTTEADVVAKCGKPKSSKEMQFRSATGVLYKRIYVTYDVIDDDGDISWHADPVQLTYEKGIVIWKTGI